MTWSDGYLKDDLVRRLPDIYMEGHTHTFDHFVNEVPYIDRKRGLLSMYKAHFVVTGHFLNWEDSYAMDMKLRPRPQGAAQIELTASNSGTNENKKVKADLLS